MTRVVPKDGSARFAVDDNPDVRAVLKDGLAGDYHVVEASDGIFGLSEVMTGEQHIALIITDLQMPEVNGVDFVKNLPENVPTIVISGFLDIPEFQEALERFQDFSCG